MSPELAMWTAVLRLVTEAVIIIAYALSQLIRELKGLGVT